jgi:predicted TIM-barrel fold metal-dependent hydrolase
MRIDADAHVDETEATWDYMDACDAKLKPVCVEPPAEQVLASASGDKRRHRLWLIDGRLSLRRTRSDSTTGTTREVRELEDIPGRLQRMDALGVDVQVLYPTILLHAIATRPDVDVALCRSYNRWLADKTACANGRLRWVAVPPLLDVPKAIEEMRWAKEHGACGVMKRAFEHGKLASDPYYFPFYEEAARLDLAVCIHSGSGNPFVAYASPFDGDVRQFDKPHIGAFESLLMYGIPQRFPGLRVGFIEVMASWVPYVMSDLGAKNKFNITRKGWGLKEDLIRDSRFYIAVQTSDDLPYILTYGTADSLVVATDMSHDDQSAVAGVYQYFEDMASRGEVEPEVVSKMFDANPRALYGL